MESHLTDIARVIQLAVAPVFLLTAIATLITALNARLGRIVDRRRVLSDRLRDQAGAQAADQAEEVRAELDSISRRIALIYHAIVAAVLGALAVCLVVAGAFIGALVSVDLAKAVAVLFVVAMFALICGLTMFLREVFLAVAGHRRVIR